MLLLADDRPPGGADLDHRVARGALGVVHALGRHHELGAAVGRVGPAGDVAEPLELVDGVHDGRLGEPCALGQLGDPRAGRADVLADREQRRPQIVEAVTGELAGDELLHEQRRVAEEVAEVGGAARREAGEEALRLTFVRRSNHNG